MDFLCHRQLSRYTTGIVILLSLALGACGAGGGGGGGSSTSTDPAGSQALVDQGVTDLQTLVQTLSTATPPPYSTIASVSDKFVGATQLDPNNPDAAFFGALAKILLLLDSEESQTFLAKLGWTQAFRSNEDDFQAFITAVQASVDGALGSTGAATDGQESGTSGIPWPVKNPDEFVLGQGGNLTYADLIAFVTVTLPVQVHSAVDLLGTIPPDWSYHLTLTLPPAGDGGAKTAQVATGEPTTVTVEIDYTDAMALRAALSGAEAALAVPGIWTYTGVDAFIAANAATPAGADLDNAIKAYFASADQPLSNNPAGVERVATALTLFFDSFDKALGSLAAETDDQSDDLLSVSGTFVSGNLRYDQEADVINYGLNAVRQTAADLKAAMTAGKPIRVYQPVAFISSFATCDPIAGAATAFDILNVPQNDQAGSVDEIVEYQAVTALDGSARSPGAASPKGGYWFQIVLNEAADLSIWATDGENTSGSIAYEVDGTLVPWDSDATSYDGSNFGISIAQGYFDATYHDLTGMNAQFPLTLWVRVTSGSSSFALHVRSSPDGTTAQPIFLKGGGGRYFRAETYQIAEVGKANLGNLIKLAGNLFGLSDRSTLGVDTGNTELSIPVTSLSFHAPDIRASITSVLPNITTFAAPLTGSGLVDLLDLGADPSPLAGITGLDDQVNLDTVLWESGSFGEFCALPKYLTQARLLPGGHSIGVGF